MRTVVVPEELLELSEGEARRRWLDVRNAAVLRRLTWALLFVAFIEFVQAVEGEDPLGIVAALINGALLSGLLLLIRRGHLADRVRTALIATILFQAVVVAIEARAEIGATGWLFPFAIVLVLARLRFSEMATLGAGIWLVGATTAVFDALLGDPLDQGTLIGLAVLLTLAGAAGSLLTRRAARAFRAAWALDFERYSERARMKQELEAARQIQLSMLPRGAPSIGWLDVAALSLPATEVGGDYYDFFPLAEDRLAVVVADVAGHGLPSGMVLAGVRSCLYLLRAELDDPVRVLERLDGMVRETASGRTFVTLSLALLDRTRGCVSVACAGHPPLLLRGAGAQAVVEVGGQSLPLGAGPRHGFTVERAPLAPGDRLVMMTDGIAETVDAGGSPYGYERLHAAIAAAPGDVGAAALREALLTDLWAFKGAAPQVDDVTLVTLAVSA